MDVKSIEIYFPDVKVINSFKESGQKFVFLIDHPKYEITILKIVKEKDERTVREIEIATKYNIRNTPKIFEFDIVKIDGKEYMYIIEEYIEGNTLSDEIKTKSFPLYKSLDLLESLLETAIELEKSKIVHRDIKPDNIICSNSGKYYLIDFGIARMLNATSLTFTKAVIGPHTPGYGAPELFQYSKSEIYIRADLFAIGVVVYESIFKKHPFITGNELDINEIWFKTATVVPQSLYIPGDMDKKLIGFLQTLMQKHISRRPPTAKRALEWFSIIKDTVEINN